jgi:hypothetical protein
MLMARQGAAQLLMRGQPAGGARGWCRAGPATQHRAPCCGPEARALELVGGGRLPSATHGNRCQHATPCPHARPPLCAPPPAGRVLHPLPLPGRHRRAHHRRPQPPLHSHGAAHRRGRGHHDHRLGRRGWWLACPGGARIAGLVARLVPCGVWPGATLRGASRRTVDRPLWHLPRRLLAAQAKVALLLPGAASPGQGQSSSSSS